MGHGRYGVALVFYVTGGVPESELATLVVHHLVGDVTCAACLFFMPMDVTEQLPSRAILFIEFVQFIIPEFFFYHLPRKHSLLKRQPINHRRLARLTIPNHHHAQLVTPAPNSAHYFGHEPVIAPLVQLLNNVYKLVFIQVCQHFWKG